MKLFPRLFKKTSTGAIQYWHIGVAGFEMESHIITEYGQINTDSPQKTTDVISQGKNIGKKNETSAHQQALFEAQAKWQKQKKKGYVESIEAAQKDELDALIEGGVVPMLAHSFADHGHKIKYPCYAQPKLDGIRCIAIVKDGKCTLWSRTRKPITGVPHIAKELEEHFKEGVFDGELYNHSFKKDFEKIVSFVRQEEPAEGCEVVQYHIYDLVSDSSFFNRLIGMNMLNKPYKHIKFVHTHPVHNEEELVDRFNEFVGEGYEGAMARNSDAKYVNKRSYDLQKVKEFEDAEFDIVGVEEGRGKLQGHVGAFVCRTTDGKEFLAKMSGDTAKLKEYFENHSLWQSKRLTVKYQGLTGACGVPRFPVGIAIRDYE